MNIILPRNHALLEKRSEGYVHSFAFTIRTKPTRHKQSCNICAKEFEVGDRQILLNVQHLFGYAEKGKKTRFQAMPAGWVGKFRDKPVITYCRKHYLHPDCYACHVNRKFIEGQLYGLLNYALCEKCEHKFSCLTGETYNKEIDPTMWE